MARHPVLTTIYSLILYVALFIPVLWLGKIAVIALGLLTIAFGLLKVAGAVAQATQHADVPIAKDPNADLATDVEAEARSIATGLGMKSDEIVVRTWPDGKRPLPGGNAGALRLSDGRGLIFATRDLMLYPRAQLRGILAHELGHVARNDVRRKYRAAIVLPLLYLAVRLPFAGHGLKTAFTGAVVASVVVHAAVLVQRMRARRSEVACDLIALGVPDADLPGALAEMTRSAEAAGMPPVRDRFWRVEDIGRTHPSLANRLVDMQKAQARRSR